MPAKPILTTGPWIAAATYLAITVKDYLSEWDNPIPDLSHRLHLRKQLKTALEKFEAAEQ